MTKAWPSKLAQMPWVCAAWRSSSAWKPWRTSSRQDCVRAMVWLPSTRTPVFSESTTSSTLPRMRVPTLPSKRWVRMLPW